MKIKSTRDGFGSYTLTDLDTGRTVHICSFSRADGANFNGWIAKAMWTNFLYTDPLPTKRQAMHEAAAMLKEAKG